MLANNDIFNGCSLFTPLLVIGMIIIFISWPRFYCAAVADDGTRLDFKGDRRIWNGRLINGLLRGNAVLEIFVEEVSNGHYLFNTTLEIIKLNTVEPPLMATSLQRPLFFVPADKRSIHWILFKTSLQYNGHLFTKATSLQRPLSSVPKVAVVERFDCRSFKTT